LRIIFFSHVCTRLTHRLIVYVLAQTTMNVSSMEKTGWQNLIWCHSLWNTSH